MDDKMNYFMSKTLYNFFQKKNEKFIQIETENTTRNN